MSKTYSAGIVTAYGAAKRAGYQGTYEDFCRQQAGYAESAATVEQAKTAAQTAANTATTKAGEAATAATAAQTAKTQTEAAASQALTDISTARSGAISAVQTEGQTQTANARAQAQAAATSATTASAKASEASASATSAGQSATNAATSATSAASSASAAQAVLNSIPEDYSDLSEDVVQLKADLDSVTNLHFNPIDFSIIGTGYINWNDGTTANSSISSYTDYIDISNYTHIKYKRQGNASMSASAGIAFYDSSKSFIANSGISLALKQESTGYVAELYETSVPENAKYARFSVYTNTQTYGDFELYGQREIVNVVNSMSSDIEQNHGDIVELGGRIFEPKDVPINVSAITGINVKSGYNAANGSISIEMSPNSLYDSYWFVPDTDIDIWVGSLSVSYFAIVVGNGEYSATSETTNGYYIHCKTGSTRYRTSDNNLPTVLNKLHVPAGYPVAFTITAGNIDKVYGLNTIYVVKDEFKNEVIGSIATKQKYIKYVSGSGIDSSIEKVEIYIPSSTGYIRYDLVHTVKQTINADVWRIGLVSHVTDMFVDDFAITTSGEWECAVKLSGRNDFSGGYAHGDEVMQNVAFILDGSPVTITDYTDMTTFTDFVVIEDSKLYDPNDSETVYANHGSMHIFNNDGMRILQSLKFISAVTVVTAYMAMLPISKTVSNMVSPDSTFVPLSTANAIRIYDTEDVTIYKTDGNVMARFSVPKFEYLNDEGYTFLCVDNGSTTYNKCYFCNTLSEVSVPSGKLIKSETVYQFSVGA